VSGAQGQDASIVDGTEARRRTVEDTRKVIKDYILREFLPGESPDKLTDATPLISGKVLDSLSTLKLVSFLEDTFKVQIEPHEADVEHLDTISRIAGLVHSKK
jgi:acyl carrier protein